MSETIATNIAEEATFPSNLDPDFSRILFTCSPTPLLIFDRTTLRVLKANPAASELYDLPCDDLRLLSLNELRAGDLDGSKPLASNSRRELHVRRDGTTIEVELSVFPIGFSGNQASLCFLKQLEQEYRWKQQLKQAVQELERSRTEFSQSIMMATHDLQEPLRMISTYLTRIEREYKNKALDSVGLEYLGYAISNANWMRKLVDDILLYSALNHDEGNMEGVDCNKLLKNVCSTLKLATEESGAQISWEELPIVSACGSQLALVFSNLISNAIKFRGNSRPEVTISWKRVGTEIQFEVRDNGIGIEPQNIETVFQMFHRLGDRKQTGSGIGLATCKRIVERHRGKIWVQSEPGKGSCFFFTLPGDP